MNNKHIGSSFDDFLDDEELLNEAETVAKQRISEFENNKLLNSGFLFEKGLELRQCVKSWEPEARLLGNVLALEIKAVLDDYLKLRLEKGIKKFKI